MANLPVAMAVGQIQSRKKTATETSVPCTLQRKQERNTQGTPLGSNHRLWDTQELSKHGEEISRKNHSQSNNSSINLAINRSINQSINQSTIQGFFRSINQSLYRTKAQSRRLNWTVKLINQPINPCRTLLKHIPCIQVQRKSKFHAKINR